MTTVHLRLAIFVNCLVAAWGASGFYAKRQKTRHQKLILFPSIASMTIGFKVAGWTVFSKWLLEISGDVHYGISVCGKVLMWSLKGSMKICANPWFQFCLALGKVRAEPFQKCQAGPSLTKVGPNLTEMNPGSPILISSQLCKCATIHSPRYAILGSYSRAHLQTPANPTLKPFKKQPHLKTSTMVALMYVIWF
jgi:hypothetical protein